MNINNNQNYDRRTEQMDRRTEQIQRSTQQGTTGQMTPMTGTQTQMTTMPSDRALSPVTSMTPTTLESSYYTAGLLRNFIGQRMRVQFLIGTNGPLIDLTGTLIEVGASYIILQPTDTDDLVICDLYTIKFVTVFR